MLANNRFHSKEGAMNRAKQRALPLHQADCRITIMTEKQTELLRLLAELVLQAFKSVATGDGGETWKK
jgi:hypothetical protein